MASFKERFNLTVNLCNLLFFFTWCYLQAKSDKFELSYGSSIILSHDKTSYNLVSSDASWSMGSGQKVVTLSQDSIQNSEDFVYWFLKEGHFSNKRPTGSPVKCGDTIRFENLLLGSNLHSHSFKASLSNNNEVSTYGSDGSGDTMDDWIILCDTNKKIRIEEGDAFYLKHVHMGGYLHAQESNKFTNKNCPRCPIVGHLEVNVKAQKSKTNDCKWKFYPGTLFQNSKSTEDITYTQSNLDEL